MDDTTAEQDVAHLRAEAQRCFDELTTVSDPLMQRKLAKLAVELEELAFALEREQQRGAD